MIDHHVHCGECGLEIATTVKIAGGKTKEVQINAGTQFALVATPDGLVPVPKQVPLCVSCHEYIQKQAQQAASKIIVPKVQAPTNLRPVS